MVDPYLRAGNSSSWNIWDGLGSKDAILERLAKAVPARKKMVDKRRRKGKYARKLRRATKREIPRRGAVTKMKTEKTAERIADREKPKVESQVLQKRPAASLNSTRARIVKFSRQYDEVTRSESRTSELTANKRL